jgi:hypothetical protein
MSCSCVVVFGRGHERVCAACSILFQGKRKVELVWNGKTRDVCSALPAASWN